MDNGESGIPYYEKNEGDECWLCFTYFIIYIYITLRIDHSKLFADYILFIWVVVITNVNVTEGFEIIAEERIKSGKEEAGTISFYQAYDKL